MLCPAKPVLSLYNQGTAMNAKQIGKRVREWFVAAAERKDGQVFTSSRKFGITMRRGTFCGHSLSRLT